MALFGIEELSWKTQVKATRDCQLKALLVLVLAVLLAFGAEGRSLPQHRGLAGVTVFYVTRYGAKPDSTTDSALAFMRAWNAACQSGGPAKLLIPQGTFMAGEVIFQGPCTGPKPITIEIQGTVLSRTELNLYPNNVWISLKNIDGVVVTGSGTLNGQGQKSWQFNNRGQGGGTLLPLTLLLQNVNNSVVQGIKMVDSKGFHMKLHNTFNVNVTNLNIKAPGDSPNTDGVHISDSQLVTVSHTIIGTGDDCVSIGDGNSNIKVFNITCGPGHGISIGSLGKRKDEDDVAGVTVKNCTLTGTTNGARIKTYHGSPEMQASGIVFEHLILNQVANPIIIDQNYNSKKIPEPSKVKLRDIHFRNIRGTSSTPIAVTLNCSETVPCEGVELANIDLAPARGVSALSYVCSNVTPTVSGTMNPPACQ